MAELIEVYMTKYGITALKAFECIQNGYDAAEAWEKASCEVFGEGTSSQTKSCPKGAFLGLFSDSKSDNAQYAIKAIYILKENPDRVYKPRQLWRLVLSALNENEGKTYNEQMHVVLALWEYPKSRSVLE